VHPSQRSDGRGAKSSALHREGGEVDFGVTVSVGVVFFEQQLAFVVGIRAVTRNS
jgi:hypothetical protein